MQLSGKFKKVLYEAKDSNYKVALFKIKETDLEEYAHKEIKVIGNIYNLKIDALYALKGNFDFSDKYQEEQFKVEESSLIKPTNEEELIAFFESPFVKGCGPKMAKKIVDEFHEDAIDIIKSDYHHLFKVKGMSLKMADKIYQSLILYDLEAEIISKLQKEGFNINEASLILNYFKDETIDIVENHFYEIKKVLDFKKVDDLYTLNHDLKSEERINNCFLESLNLLSIYEGHTFAYQEEIIKYLNSFFNLNLTDEEFISSELDLIKSGDLIVRDKHYALKLFDNNELYISHKLRIINDQKIKKIKDFDEKIKRIETNLNIKYDDSQKKAIENAINNNFTIISGGPGTGKTTLVKAIVELYINEEQLNYQEELERIALLAPTGRASKKLSESVVFPSSTIHRFLGWHKETDSFIYNETNLVNQKLIIVDEASMIDLNLFASLLKALNSNIKLILVGDAFQLPSVGAGRVLNDLIDSDLFTFIPLNKIYRQSENSYIPYLAKQIKNSDLDDEYLIKKDDYNFLICEQNQILSLLEEVIKKALAKGLNENNIQVLAPIYKGMNGIDNLNILLEKIYNPESRSKKIFIYHNIRYQENDKVLQLINDPDNNVFNGDIGFITKIDLGKEKTITINFDGNIIDYKPSDLKKIRLAYAISVHKSQGSEFDHIIMPISKEYFVMFYNKLIYTAVSRAKKSLILIGDPHLFASGVNNKYADGRHTSLIDRLKDEYNL